MRPQARSQKRRRLRRLAGGTGAVMRWRVSVAARVVVLAIVFMSGAGYASPAAFTGRGSVEQVYVTGLGLSQQMSLLNSAGTTVTTRQASSLGGLVFRNVAPGTGYTVQPTAGGAA